MGPSHAAQAAGDVARLAGAGGAVGGDLRDPGGGLGRPRLVGDVDVDEKRKKKMKNENEK